MMTRRLLVSCACGALAAAMFALPSASASAAGAKVLVLTRSDEGTGPPAKQGEPAHVSNFVSWPGLESTCGGTDEGGTLGKNPSGTVKVSGSEAPVGVCFSDAEFKLEPGSIAIKRFSVAKTGAVKLTGRLEVTVGECSYRATKLVGTQTFGEEQEWLDSVTGTAKRVAPSAKSCAKSTPVEDAAAAADGEGFNYIAELTS